MPQREDQPTSQDQRVEVAHGRAETGTDRVRWSQLVGRRVSLRHRIGHRDGRPLYTDAVGELSTDGETLIVQTRRGPVRVDPEAVVAIRAVPPPVPKRPSRAAVAQLEQLCADAWPAGVTEPLGSWRLRATGDGGAWVNTTLAIGDPGMPIAAALTTVIAFATRHGITPRVLVPIESPQDRAIRSAGWQPDTDVGSAEIAVLVTEISTLAGDRDQQHLSPQEPGKHAPTTALLTDVPSSDWWQLALGREPRTTERRAFVPDGPLDYAFGIAYEPDSRAVGAVRACVVFDHLHLALLAVSPRTDHREAVTRLLRQAATWGRGHGARWVALQAALEDTAVRSVCAHLGFREHHRSHYLRPPNRRPSRANA